MCMRSRTNSLLRRRCRVGGESVESALLLRRSDEGRLRHLLSEHATSIVIDALQGGPASVLHLLLEICGEYRATSEVSPFHASTENRTDDELQSLRFVPPLINLGLDARRPTSTAYALGIDFIPSQSSHLFLSHLRHRFAFLSDVDFVNPYLSLTNLKPGATAESIQYMVGYTELVIELAMKLLLELELGVLEEIVQYLAGQMRCAFSLVGCDSGALYRLAEGLMEVVRAFPPSLTTLSPIIAVFSLGGIMEYEEVDLHLEVLRTITSLSMEPGAVATTISSHLLSSLSTLPPNSSTLLAISHSLGSATQYHLECGILLYTLENYDNLFDVKRKNQPLADPPIERTILEEKLKESERECLRIEGEVQAGTTSSSSPIRPAKNPAHAYRYEEMISSWVTTPIRPSSTALLRSEKRIEENPLPRSPFGKYPHHPPSSAFSIRIRPLKFPTPKKAFTTTARRGAPASSKLKPFFLPPPPPVSRLSREVLVDSAESEEEGGEESEEEGGGNDEWTEPIHALSDSDCDPATDAADEMAVKHLLLQPISAKPLSKRSREEDHDIDDLDILSNVVAAAPQAKRKQPTSRKVVVRKKSKEMRRREEESEDELAM